MRTTTPYETLAPWPSRAALWLFKRQNRVPRDSDGIVTAFRDGEVTLRENRRTEGFTNAVAEHGYQGVRAGDLVIHSMDAFAGAVGVSDSDGKASPVVHCYRPTANIDPRFYAYLLRDAARSGFITSLAKGIRERSTAFDTQAFQSLMLPVPEFKEQRAIADFLDTETARIDALIEKKRRLDELIRVRLSILIGVTTSEGKATQVRRFISLRTSGPRGWAERVGLSGVPFIRSANLQVDSIIIKWDGMGFVQESESHKAERSRVRAGDVLVGITGANTGWVGFAERLHDGGYVSQHVGLLRPREINPKWLAYGVSSPSSREQLLGGQYGGTKQQLSLDELAELTIYVPLLERQEELISRLDQQVSSADRLRSKIQQQIELLTEHRQALVIAAVTGQVEFPGELGHKPYPL